jgi:hypothetical protein
MAQKEETFDIEQRVRELCELIQNRVSNPGDQETLSGKTESAITSELDEKRSKASALKQVKTVQIMASSSASSSSAINDKKSPMGEKSPASRSGDQSPSPTRPSVLVSNILQELEDDRIRLSSDLTVMERENVHLKNERYQMYLLLQQLEQALKSADGKNALLEQNLASTK